MNFPSSPTVGQTYALGSKTWVWNGSAWDLQSAAPNNLTLDYVQLNTSATVTDAVGRIRWDANQGTADLGLLGGNIVQKLGQSLVAYVTNAEAVTITKGQAVYLFSAVGDRASVKLAYNTADAASAKTLGLVAEDIAAGASGFVMCQGVAYKMNTAAFTAGDSLYLGATAGSLTTTKPYAPNHLVYIGTVEKANAGNGQIYVRVQNGYELDELHNVSAQSPTTGQTIVWNGSTSLWEKNTVSLTVGVTGTLPVANGGTGQTTYTDGQLLIGNSTGNTLSKATLTAGSNITITNGNGSITIASTGGGGASAATPTVEGTVYGKMTASGGTPYLTALGYNAAASTTGELCTAVGVEALYNNTSGQNNSAFGYRTLFANSSGSDNCGFGRGSLRFNTTGVSLVAIGNSALNANTTGQQNTAVGVSALLSNTTASYSTAVGYQAAYSLSGSNGYTTAIGYQALYTQSTGYSNTAVGYQSGYLMTTGIQNSMSGIEALRSNTTGSYNSAFGAYALNSNTTANNNTAVGYQALYSSNTASNTAVGYQAASALTTGVANTVFGKNTGGSLTSGSYNVFLGHEAGYYINAVTTGSLNVAIGYGVGLAAATDDYEIVISTPYGSVGKGSYTAFINANTGGTYNGANTTTWATTSDQRLKKNIVNNNVGLEKLTQIQVRNFEYRVEDEITELPKNQAIKKTGLQLGVIAQELQQILPDCVKTESTGVMSVQSDNLTWYMINAIKELKAEFDAYKLTHP